MEISYDLLMHNCDMAIFLCKAFDFCLDSLLSVLAILLFFQGNLVLSVQIGSTEAERNAD